MIENKYINLCQAKKTPNNVEYSTAAYPDCTANDAKVPFSYHIFLAARLFHTSFTYITMEANQA